MDMSPTSTVFLIAAPLIAWRLYSRIRRLIGRQRSSPARHWSTAILFPILIVLIGFTALTSPTALAGLAAGLAVGIGLAVWGLKLTNFERTESGYFYTPNAHIGIALSALFVCRIGYRFYQFYTLSGADAQAATQNFGRSPWTTLIFGMMAGYYTWYAIGLLRWRASAPLTSAPSVPAQPVSPGPSESGAS